MNAAQIYMEDYNFEPVRYCNKVRMSYSMNSASCSQRKIINNIQKEDIASVKRISPNLETRFSKSSKYQKTIKQEHSKNVYINVPIYIMYHILMHLKRHFEYNLSKNDFNDEPMSKLIKESHLFTSDNFRESPRVKSELLKHALSPQLSYLRLSLRSFPLGHPWFEKFINKVKVDLIGKKLWEEFNKLGTETILTRAGRMFPNLQIRISGMHPKALYVILVEFAPIDNHRYKYEYETFRWMIACEEFTSRPSRVYWHSDSPASGELWMKNIVDFTKCKLTNNFFDDHGHILMHSMHKYQPRIYVVYWDGSLPLNIDPPELLRISCCKEFIFSETKCIAVTAYQNSQFDLKQPC
ncbi:T-box transcription factor TBX15 isoform X2 [Hydra vulgaris]|uniref:T-box transcription factor TBX15 isoform X2 n=1 Tax=Hydra vulgaris TaxID=6087 RepID=UPI001F5FCFAD|nr:T-box transcription factor TBX15 isoform X2 [Hydra vulgaris]